MACRSLVWPSEAWYGLPKLGKACRSLVWPASVPTCLGRGRRREQRSARQAVEEQAAPGLETPLLALQTRKQKCSFIINHLIWEEFESYHKMTMPYNQMLTYANIEIWYLIINFYSEESILFLRKNITMGSNIFTFVFLKIHWWTEEHQPFYNCPLRIEIPPPNIKLPQTCRPLTVGKYWSNAEHMQLK